MLKALPLLFFLCLSLFAQSLQSIAALDIETGAYAGSYPASFTALGNDVYALANIGDQRLLVKMENGSAANTSEVRYDNQTIPALALERHGDVLFAHVNVGMYIIEAANAAPHYLPTSAYWIGTAPDGQLMVLDSAFMLHRYVSGVGLQPVGKLDEGTARLSAPFPYGNGFYYLAYEVGGAIELRAITSGGERSLVTTLGTSNDPDLGFGNALATVANGELFIAFTHTYDMSQLWRTDGTAAGTHLIFEHNYEGYAPAFISLVTWNQGIAFSTATESNLFLYRNGQLETLPIDNSNVPLGRLTPLGQNLLFLAQGGVYRKGVSGPPQLLYSGHLTQDSRPMVIGNGRAYLLTEDGLWSSDGTSAGSGLTALTGYHAQGDPFPRPNEIWLAGNHQGYYPELLVLPNSGTPQIHDLNPAISEYPEHRTYALGTHLLYHNPATQELHAVTGTTDIVLDSSVHRILPQTASHLYYLKFLGTGTQLWRTDGTLAGTTLLLTNGGEGLPSVQYVYPSGDQLYYTNELNNIYTVYRLRADGTSEQLTGYDTNYVSYYADGLGGLYLTGQIGSGLNLWHVAAGETVFQQVFTLDGYVDGSPTYTMVGNRLWMRVVRYGNDPNITLISSDGTATGTFTYVEAARAATLPIEIEGRAAMTVAIDGLEGLVLSDGSGPLELSDLAVMLAADAELFNGHAFGQVFGTEEDDENQLWRYDLESGEALFLTTLASGLRPFQRVEVGETTLLMLAGQGRVELWLSDGSAEGTEQLATFEGDAKPGLVLGERFYFIARGPAGDRQQRLHVWSAAEGTQLVAASAALSHPDSLVAIDEHLYFLADNQFHYGLYRLGEGSSLPAIQLTAKRLGARSEFYRINAEQIAGASYSWQLQNAIAVRPANRSSLLIRASRHLTTKITVIVTLANGDLRVGTLELTVPRSVADESIVPVKTRR